MIWWSLGIIWSNTNNECTDPEQSAIDECFQRDPCCNPAGDTFWRERLLLGMFFRLFNWWVKREKETERESVREREMVYMWTECASMCVEIISSMNVTILSSLSICIINVLSLFLSLSVDQHFFLSFLWIQTGTPPPVTPALTQI